MAQKRVLRTTGRPPEQEDDEEETWGEWAKGSYARAWYILLCIFIDAFVFLETGTGDTFVSWGLGLIVLILIIMAETYIFVKLWGREGRWARGR